MSELSFLTVIVSLAVCSLLVYGIFQYMKVRLTILEQSHREQAMILQQYIEESSSDIHRLYQISTTRSSLNEPVQPFPPNGTIISEYAEEQNNNGNPVVFNEPHTIHLDTAFFQNKRSSNLIEISSDSANTTDSENENDNDSSSESETDSDDSQTDSDDSQTDSDDSQTDSDDSETETEINCECDNHETIQVCGIKNEDNSIELKLDDIHTSDIKTITVDLGTIEESASSISISNDVLSMLYKKAQQTPLPEDNDLDENITTSTTVVESFETLTPVHVPLSAKSVPELKQLLKELCKNQPEKYPEIQKLKKTELIYAIKQLQQ